MAYRRQTWLRALAYTAGAVLALAGARGARADSITPDVLGPNRPALTPAIQGGPVSANGLVTTQYQQVGLGFPDAGALIDIGGVSAWAPVVQSAAASTLDFDGGPVKGAPVRPGTSLPNPADVLGVRFANSKPGFGVVTAFGEGNRFLGSSTVADIGAPGNDLVTVSAHGIRSFAAVLTLTPPAGVPQSAAADPLVWGVREVNFGQSTHLTPEPASLVLGGFGGLGLAGYSWRRRRGTPART